MDYREALRVAHDYRRSNPSTWSDKWTRWVEDMEGEVCSRKRLAVIVPIALKLPALAKRINITMDPYLLAEVDRSAKERGMGRSAFLAEGARRLLTAG